MFSEEDIEIFRIIVDLPKQEEKENLIEQFISKYPLSTLKLDAMQELMIMIKKTLDRLPTMVLSGPGVSLNISKEKMVFEITKERLIESSLSEATKGIKPFSEDNLKRVTTDFNFIAANILGLLQIETLKVKGYMSVSKKIDRDLTFDNFFTSDFWNRFREFEETHVSGLQIDYNKPAIEAVVPHKIRLSGNKKEVTCSVTFNFELKGPIDFNSMTKDELEMINVIYKKLTEVT
jgi:hypothetical protein